METTQRNTVVWDKENEFENPPPEKPCSVFCFFFNTADYLFLILLV